MSELDGDQDWLREGAAVTYFSFLYDRPVRVRSGTVTRVLKRDVVIDGIMPEGAKPFRFAPLRTALKEAGEVFYRLSAEFGSTTEEIHRKGSVGAARRIEEVRRLAIQHHAKRACEAASKDLTRTTATAAIERLQAWLQDDAIEK